MSALPEVSVVMGVRDGAYSLRDTLESVLTQTGVDLEFLIVDDGSTDGSDEILAEAAARDQRVIVMRQEEFGLTRALIAGCARAKGRYIARQDAGDVSLPGRLAAQKRILDADHTIAMVSCGTRFYGPGGEELFEVNQHTGDATEGLLRLDAHTIRGPSHHGSVIFRRADYERVGGYRKEFYFAQDLDLWTRLVEGERRHEATGMVMYQATLAAGSISALRRSEQVRTAELIVEAARSRRTGASEADALEKASRIRPGREGAARSRKARTLYFVAMCLRKRGDERYRGYLRAAVRQNPLLLRGWVRLFSGKVA